ncbi:MAG TPA: ATP-binding protein [Thermoanaerobaculia bacterium]|nr:ATP-binding protein [Thermoanaerobaculia bacterium]
MEEIAKKSRIRRVCLIGPESTGKTTLAASLAAHYGTAWVPEYAREYALRVARPLTAQDTTPIAEGQIALEDRIAPEAKNGLLVLDTDVLSSIAYATHCHGHCPPWITAAAKGRLSDLYLLADIDVPFVEDAAREGGPDRSEVMRVFQKVMADYAVRVTRLRGSVGERKAAAIAAIDNDLT